MKSLIKKLLKAARLAHDRSLDRKSGVVTDSHLHEVPEGTVNDDPQPYMAPPWAHVRIILREFKLGPEDVLVDYGCGAGRILCAAAVGEVGKVIGVEYSAPLV
jgi:hypothetical protein